MDTTKLKRFAQEARNILMKGVAQRLSTLGITADSITERPQVMGGGATFQGKTVTLDFVKTWQSIAHNVESRGYRVVVEEAAYTWFNRLVAIRIMAKNGLVAPLLRFESESVHIPYIVSEARHGRLPQLTAERQAQWDVIANDDSKTDEQFMLLISAWCDNNPIINAAFGSLDDYSSLLIPSNILKDDGFVDMLNHTDYLTDDDYRSPELIGWLYQFYISERKDEVFAKKGKYDSDEIPAATQIFTPNWIVKYMVENTLGRIYLDANPWETELQKDWKYLVDTPDGYDERKNTQMLELENLRTGDLACGSGHILNEQFGILYSMYINDGYSPRNAIESIFRKNLIGIDIDLRAKQLATFSLLLKSCQIDKSLASSPIMPRVYGMPHIEAIPTLEYPNPKIKEETEACFKLMLDAETLGSIMKFEISEVTRQWIQTQAESGDPMSVITNCYNIILALTEKYDALAMNPPYMPTNRNDVLNTYVNKYYKEGKSDLFAVFMQQSMDLLRDRGLMAMINMQSWMFLSSYEDLRKLFLDTYTLHSMLHLGPRTFDELSGEVVQNTSFVFEKLMPSDGTSGNYYRLVEGVNSSDKETMFIAMQYSACTTSGKRYRFDNIPQKNFECIPNSPMAYWVSKNILKAFEKSQVRNIAFFKRGIGTGDNNKFLRFWFEVAAKKTSIMSPPFMCKWFKYNKGGSFRRWYGNREYVVDWENDGERIKNNYNENGKLASRPQNMQYNFVKNISYSSLSSGTLSFRSFDDFINDQAGNYFILRDQKNYTYLLALLNSKVSEYFKNIKNATLNITADDLLAIPFIVNEPIQIIDYAEWNLSISKSDWDAHETSWDFTENELVAKSKEGTKNLRDLVALYKAKWEHMFTQLHRNEEELNRRFIEIYGLQDELDYHVPFDEITILQQGEINWEEGRPRPVSTTPYLDRDEEIKIHGDKLPHWNQDGKMVFFTFRLADSLPQSKIEELKIQQDNWLKLHPKPWDETTEKEYHKTFTTRIEELIDNGYGSCILDDNSVADIVEQTLRHDDDKKYSLISYVIMPNHVHVLVELYEGLTIDKLMQEWKSVSSHKIKKLIGDKWPGWMEKYHDRIIRNDEHMKNVINYIHKNYSLGRGVPSPRLLGRGVPSPRLLGRGVPSPRLLGRGVPSPRYYINVTTSVDTTARGRASSQLPWNDDVIIKQLISYAMGCIMGRYSIDKPGLILANQGDTEDAYYQIVYGAPKSSIPADQAYFEVDDDGIVPLMSANLELTDNAPLRFKKWLEATFGAENLVENINFVQQALGKTIEAYFQKDFWKDHKKMYQNRPIYWLFTSKKGAFQCLVYMHRMDAYTPERIRTRYLLPHIDWLKRRQDELQRRASSLNTSERRELDNITKQIEECLEYHDRLHVIADAQQAIDLDDGVVVNYAKFGDVVAKLR